MVMRSRDSRGTAMFDGVWRVPFTVTPFLPSTCSSQLPAGRTLDQRPSSYVLSASHHERAVRGLLRSKLYFISACVREIVWFSPALQLSDVNGRLCAGNNGTVGQKCWEPRTQLDVYRGFAPPAQRDLVALAGEVDAASFKLTEAAALHARVELAQHHTGGLLRD